MVFFVLQKVQFSAGTGIIFHMSDIQPTPPISDTQPRKVKSRRIAVLISASIVLIAIALGSAAGYAQGMGTRMNIQQTSDAKSIVEQYDLAEKDVAEKRYANARERLNYIMEKNPSYPGAAELLTKLMVEMAVTPSLTPTTIPSATPTPDLRSQETIFNQAKEQLKNSEWTNALASLDQLRKSDPNYKAALVDGMYYTGLRNRGIDEIIGNREFAQTTNLEGGIYDLTLAERFGPLDGQADGMRTWARMYIIGASFWEIDWGQAVNYFSQVANQTPNLRDASNITASQRYYQALLKYGDQQVAAGGRQKDRCLALDTWNMAQSISALNEEYTNKFNELNLKCNPPTDVPAPEEPQATVAP